MVKSGVNYNILIIGGVILGGLYLFSVIKKGNVAQNYTSGLTGNTISEASQPTIRTDLRQTGLTNRAVYRQETRLTRAELRQNSRIVRALNRQENRREIFDIIF